MFGSKLTLISLHLPFLAQGQLPGNVGPLTSASNKATARTCDVTDHGAVSDGKTDVGPAITAAFNDCKSGGLVVIPGGHYALASWVTLSGGNAWAMQLDGIVSRSGTAGGVRKSPSFCSAIYSHEELRT